MSDPVNPPVVDGDPAGGSGNQPEPKKDIVTYETHRKLLDEKKKVQQERDALLAEKNQRVDEEAKKRGDYETIIKTRDDRIKELETKYGSLETRILEAQKLSAVLKTAGAPIDAKWHNLINTGDIKVNPDTGEIDEMAVTKVVENLRKDWPEMFKNPSAPNLPANAPQGNGAGKISKDEWLKLSDADMAKYKPEQIIGL